MTLLARTPREHSMMSDCCCMQGMARNAESLRVTCSCAGGVCPGNKRAPKLTLFTGKWAVEQYATACNKVSCWTRIPKLPWWIANVPNRVSLCFR